ncbi:uncharacterized protein LOC114188951 [Vigna unguiculata]|uniref:uncharacterized protein LOC114188951 n=1 Tax=Vigna unguiculata TaxID=3917 RepID=UPI00101656D6|nr:uncharacterized protein LOC114188951 [Vigna unguiculata]
MRARIEEESSKNSTEVSKTKVGDSNVSNPKVISHEMLLTQKTLLHTLHEEQPSYLLLCQVILTCLSSSSLKDLLPSIVALLQEFQDPFSKDGPRGLPPFRGIKHQIDFFPGASIPDRPMYRTNPIKTKEIESQVNELLDKGWVQNSLSPCDIHVLLVSKKDGFVVNKNGVHVDPEKIKVIREWAIPKIVRDIRSSHGLAGFYEGSYPTSLLLHHP